MSKMIINVTTGDETVQKLTKLDIEQQQIDEAEINNRLTLELAEAAIKKEELDRLAEKKKAIYDKLGLTAEEVEALLA